MDSAASVSRADTIRRALRVNISQAEHEEVLAALDSLLDERDRYGEALERVLPLVVGLSERGWIQGAEATATIREALR